MPKDAKFERCVKKVSAGGKSKNSAFAVCSSTLGPPSCGKKGKGKK